jgi:DNA-binding Xre family transcriptional regulator
MRRTQTESEIMYHGVVKHRVKELMAEAGVNGMDLARYGMAVGTAYKYARGDQDNAISFAVMAALCSFFSERLKRKVDIGDIFYFAPKEDKDGQ